MKHSIKDGLILVAEITSPTVSEFCACVCLFLYDQRMILSEQICMCIAKHHLLQGTIQPVVGYIMVVADRGKSLFWNLGSACLALLTPKRKAVAQS